MPALLFGSISTLSDTSEEQRSSFNEAFTQHGLDWRWERDEYRDMLTGNGGQQRIANYAAAHDQQVDAQAVHRTKTAIFQRKLSAVPLRPRPGVSEVLTAAHEAGWQVALVTTTAPDNVADLLTALEAHIPLDAFDLVVDGSLVDEPKPAPAAYAYALEKLGIDAGQCVAIEDNVGGAQAAQAAGIACIAFPNENTVEHDFGDVPVTRHLAFDELLAAVGR